MSYTANNTFSSFHGWIAPYNDGMDSSLISTGGVTHVNLEAPIMRDVNGRCDCTGVAHDNYVGSIYNIHPSTKAFRTTRDARISGCRYKPPSHCPDLI